MYALPWCDMSANLFTLRTGEMIIAINWVFYCSCYCSIILLLLLLLFIVLKNVCVGGGGG